MNVHNVQVHAEALQRTAQDVKMYHTRLSNLEKLRDDTEEVIREQSVGLKHINMEIRKTKTIVKNLLKKLNLDVGVTPPHSESHSSE